MKGVGDGAMSIPSWLYIHLRAKSRHVYSCNHAIISYMRPKRGCETLPHFTYREKAINECAGKPAGRNGQVRQICGDICRAYLMESSNVWQRKTTVKYGTHALLDESGKRSETLPDTKKPYNDCAIKYAGRKSSVPKFRQGQSCIIRCYCA